MNLLRRVITQEQAISADGIQTFDMSSNPLSGLLIAIRPLNETSTLGNFARYFSLCQSLNRITLLHRGSSIFSMRGEDMAALNFFRHGIQPMEANPDDTDNERRCVILPCLLGRKLYDPRSCLPETSRGELQLELDIDIADTGYDGYRLSIESIEILGARPSEFERKTTTSQTFAATGDNDVFLPAGNVVRGLLLFGTTGFTGASPAPSWGRISTWMDGRQVGFSATDFEVAQMVSQAVKGRQFPGLDAHTHRVDATAMSTTQETTGPIEQGATWGNYCYLDYDPTEDDMYSINTVGATQWSVRADAETADAVRVIQIERMAG